MPIPCGVVFRPEHTEHTERRAFLRWNKRQCSGCSGCSAHSDTLAAHDGAQRLGIGMLLLYVEIVKAARPGGRTIMDHVLALILLLAMASELAIVPRAATSVLLLLTVLSFIDLIAGLSIRPERIVLEETRQAPA
jgi:hypothetical protein